MYLEATCIDLTSEKIENILRNSKPINYKWLIGRIRKQIPSLYEELCLDYYNPYQNNCRVTKNYYIYWFTQPLNILSEKPNLTI